MATKNNLDGLDGAVLRILDANLNRLREGIRVVEDIYRYAYNDKVTATSLKQLRHKARTSFYNACLENRDATEDVLRPTQKVENNRSDLKSVLIANFKRSQESARVLEEALKLHDPAEAETFKQLRYELYTLEKSLLRLS